jgi:SAM-dependent methyltransferase
MPKNLQLDDVREILLSNEELSSFVIENLKSSLASIGFSDNFLSDILNNLINLKVKEFGERWQDELKQRYSIGFFQNLVPKYFLDYIVPVTPASEKVVDIGCGTGILAKLYGQDDRFQKVLGIDINPYPEWDVVQNDKIGFKVVKEDQFNNFLGSEKPDSIVLTWTLHHMEYDEQERYLEYIHENLKVGGKIVVLEDSCSADLVPESGLERYKRFMEWNSKERRQIMSVYDWVANRVLAQRDKVPIPCAYRTLEEWSSFLEEKGFELVLKRFIGFPDDRDINTPQSLLIGTKRTRGRIYFPEEEQARAGGMPAPAGTAP